MNYLHDQMRPLFKILPSVLALVAGSGLQAAAQQNVTELYVQDSLTLKVGQKEGLSVQAFDDKGNAVLLIKYRSSDERTARVQTNGTVTGLRPGNVQVTVQAGKKTRPVQVVVVDGGPPPDSAHASADPPPGTRPDPKPAPPPPPIATLAIEPASLYLLPAETFHLNLRAARPDGSPVVSPRVSWKSLRPEVASVGDTTGIVVGVGAGQGVIQVSAPGGATASVAVVVALTEFDFGVNRLVMEVKDSQALRVVVPAQNRRELRTADLQWRTSDPGVAKVSAGGVVQAVGAGKAEIIAGGFLQERHLPVIVYREITEFAMRPAPGDTVKLPVLASREFRVRAIAADSSPVNDLPFEWQLGDPSIASFDTATGVLKAKKVGTTTLSFSLRDFRSKAWTIRVIPGNVQLEPELLGLRVGEKRRLSALAIDENGQSLGPATDLAWSTSSSGVATVSADGQVEAARVGRATVSAMVTSGHSDSVQVFVNGDLLFSSTRAGKYGVYSVQRATPTVIQPLLADSFSNLQAVVSPDGTRLAFTSDRGGGGNFSIYIAAADASRPHRLTTEPGIHSSPAWTPDGRQIAFASTHAGASQIYIVNADGSGLKALTSLAGNNQDPVISSDGRRIAFTTTQDGPATIAIMNLDGSGLTKSSDPRDRRESAPAFTPSGDLLYLAERKEGPRRFKIVFQPLGGVDRPPLFEGETPIVGFAVSRDGQWLAVATRIDPAKGAGASGLFLRPMAGGTELPVPLQPNEQIASPAF